MKKRLEAAIAFLEEQIKEAKERSEVERGMAANHVGEIGRDLAARAANDTDGWIEILETALVKAKGESAW